jgi:hypothetical protein
VNKDQKKKKTVSSVQAEREAEAAQRARLSASLRELRLKRDAELAAAEPTAPPPKRSKRQKAA